jgi:serine/threonine-protein kinase
MAASLYNMLTGAVPRNFPPGKDPWAIVIREAPVPIRQRNRAIPEKLAKVIDAALIDNPSITFKTAAELKRALEEAL